MSSHADKSRTKLVILAILMIILAAVLCVQLWLAPLMSECTAMEREIVTKELQIAQMDSDIRVTDVMREENALLSEAIRVQRDGLERSMSKAELDGLITAHLTKCGLTPKSMNTEVVEYTDCGLRVVNAEYMFQGSFSALTDFIACLNEMRAAEIRAVRAEALKNDEYSGVDGSRLNITVALSVYMNMEDDDAQTADKE
ncbi:MAG: hypothetical protein J6A16_11085, partial [Oscillospiraceae bacterium]|nr:hypothetical protein [Oscillospiraceae bacterium]